MKFAKAFNKKCDEIFKEKEVYVRFYIPFLAVPLNGPLKNNENVLIMEQYGGTEFIKFNSPK